MKTGLSVMARHSVSAGVMAMFVALAHLFPMARQSGVNAEERPGVENILNRYIEAVGGRAALEKLSTRVCKGKEITDLSSRRQPIFESYHFEAHAKIPRSCCTVTWSDSETYRKGYDGIVGWVKDKCGVRQDDRAGKSRLEWLLNPQFALCIQDYFPNPAYAGAQRVRGMLVYALESPEFHRPLFFDQQTGLLIGFGHNRELHDYREIDGIRYPHRVEMSRKGGSTTYEFSEVSHIVEINDATFAFPAAGY